LVVKNHSASSKTLRIEKHTRGVVTGADVICDDQVEVINKDLVIATMTDDVPFHVEMTVENGRGYVPAYEQYQHEPEVGIIPLDAAFSPVSRVRHLIEETRVGQRTNYDKLNLKFGRTERSRRIWRWLKPRRFLRKHLNCFITFREPGPEAGPEGGLRGMMEATGYSPVDMELEEKLNKSLAS
jgi:DNA-directed RNA polymerase subunit alpha